MFSYRRVLGSGDVIIGYLFLVLITSIYRNIFESALFGSIDPNQDLNRVLVWNQNNKIFVSVENILTNKIN